MNKETVAYLSVKALMNNPHLTFEQKCELLVQFFENLKKRVR